MIRVLHLLKTSTGAAWALRQTTELVKLGIEVHLVLPDGPMVNKYKLAGVNVHLFDPSIRITLPWQNIQKARELRKIVEQVKPDIVHSHFVATTLLMRLALQGIKIPRIFHVPGPLHLEHRLYRNLDIWSANKNDRWLASCIWTQQKYLSLGIDSSRVSLAYYGVNEDDFQFQKSSSQDIRQALNLPAESFIIGMVAYFYAPKRYLGQTRGLKGHEDLIDAIAIVNRDHPNVYCLFVGGAWDKADTYFESVKAYALKQAGKNCVFLGYREDVPKLYPQFNLAVHPSHSENVGGAVESMYAGVPTLTSNVGGFPDLVNDGETGYMCPAKSPQALANKIIEAMNNESEMHRRAKNARKRVAEVMNVQHNAKQILAFYQQILRVKEH